jgi:hypothetical protein
MGIPVSRDETAVAGATIKSSLLNNLQDAIVDGKHGLVTRYLGFAEIAEATADLDAAWGAGQAPQWQVPAADGARRFTATLGKPGDRIYEVRVLCLQTVGTVDAITAEWVKTTVTVGATTGGGFTGGSTSVAGPEGTTVTANTVLALTLTATVTIANDELHEVQIDVPAGNPGDKVIFRVEVDYDRP